MKEARLGMALLVRGEQIGISEQQGWRQQIGKRKLMKQWHAGERQEERGAHHLGAFAKQLQPCVHLKPTIGGKYAHKPTSPKQKVACFGEYP